MSASATQGGHNSRSVSFMNVTIQVVYCFVKGEMPDKKYDSISLLLFSKFSISIARLCYNLVFVVYSVCSVLNSTILKIILASHRKILVTNYRPYCTRRVKCRTTWQHPCGFVQILVIFGIKYSNILPVPAICNSVIMSPI